jgi:hypothetical protein
VLDEMKRPMTWRVTLKLRNLVTSEAVELKDVAITHEKRQALWHERRAEERRNRDADRTEK